MQAQLENTGVDESYENFEMSSGWLQNFKSHYSIGHLCGHGEIGEVNQEELPAM